VGENAILGIIYIKKANIALPPTFWLVVIKINPSNIYMLIKVTPSNKPLKKYEAVFSNGKSVHFGLKGSNTYLDNANKRPRTLNEPLSAANKIKRENYLNRHKKNENWKDPYSKGALSAFITWGNTTNLQNNINEFNRRFF
jgi:ABC-type maltose transport system permease subunit